MTSALGRYVVRHLPLLTKHAHAVRYVQRLYNPQQPGKVGLMALNDHYVPYVMNPQIVNGQNIIYIAVPRAIMVPPHLAHQANANVATALMTHITAAHPA